MAIEQIFTDIGSQIPEEVADVFVTGVVGGALVAVGVVLAVLLGLALYVYVSLAWHRIGKRLKCNNAWVAWIPFANVGLILHLGRIHWGWTFLFLVPILGWIALFVLCIIATWRAFEACGYAGWFSLSLIIPQVGLLLYLIALGFVAWHSGPEGAMQAVGTRRKRR